MVRTHHFLHLGLEAKRKERAGVPICPSKACPQWLNFLPAGPSYLLHGQTPAEAPVGPWFWRVEVPELGFGICFASGEYWQPEELSQTMLTMWSNYIFIPCGEGGSYICLLGEQRRRAAANLSEVSKRTDRLRRVLGFGHVCLILLLFVSLMKFDCIVMIVRKLTVLL